MKLGRTPLQESLYKNYLQESSLNVSVHHSLSHRIFETGSDVTKHFHSSKETLSVQEVHPYFVDWDKEVHWKQICPLKCTLSSIYILRPSEFPYDVHESIIHAVLWSKFELNEQHVNLLMNLFMENEFVSFINPPSRKSVPSINHAHVFIKKFI